MIMNVLLYEDNYKRELNTIKPITVNNGYGPHTIDKIIEKKTIR